MKEEQERPKIKLKIRKIEENEAQNNFSGEKAQTASQNSSSNVPPSNENSAPVQKIKIHAQNDEPEKEIRQKPDKNAKKRTIFQVSAIVLTVLLVIAIVVEVAVMIWLKNSTDNLKNKNDNLPKSEISISAQI